MGCLNANQDFTHWFSNIHFSGPCSRACYFCIGQWMPGQDKNNNLDRYPLLGIEKFIDEVNKRDITEINLTGTNTDPSLYKHTPKLIAYLRHHVPNARIGIRTNGVLIEDQLDTWNLFDNASVSITSFSKSVYRKTMGRGEPPDIFKIVELSKHLDLKVNIVLCPELFKRDDLAFTLVKLLWAKIKRVNLREPYGQPHIGYEKISSVVGEKPYGYKLGMPFWMIGDMEVMYWDVHYVEVESVNLYADGRVSLDYPVTLGHSKELGDVQDQSNFMQGRQAAQWVGTPHEINPK